MEHLTLDQKKELQEIRDHAEQRAMERFLLGKNELFRMERMITLHLKGLRGVSVIFLFNESTTRDHYLVRYSSVWIWVVWSNKFNAIHTLMRVTGEKMELSDYVRRMSNSSLARLVSEGVFSVTVLDILNKNN